MPALTDRQKAIIDAATRLLSERGIQELTLKNLAARVGVSEPALYRHFASKSDILKGVLDLFEDEIHAAILPSMENPVHPADAESGDEKDLHVGDRDAGAILAHFVSGIAAVLVHRPELAALLFSEEVFWSERELSGRMHALMTRTRNVVSSLVARGMESGEFRQDIDPVAISTSLIGGIRLLCTLWRLESYESDLTRDVEELWGSLRRSITASSCQP